MVFRFLGPRASASSVRKKVCLIEDEENDEEDVSRFHACLLGMLSELNMLPLMRRAIYPGSFDPVTNGHLDVIERARKLFDEVVVAVAHNVQKQPLFTLEERLDFLRASLNGAERVEIAPLDGLLVDFAVQQNATAIVRGLRAVSDFEFEFQMALMNRKLEASVETIFLMPKEEYTYLSSRIVKEIARLGGDVRAFVPACVMGKFLKKLERLSSKRPSRLSPERFRE